MSSYTPAQASRVANYRRQRMNDSMSESQLPDESVLVGEARPIGNAPRDGRASGRGTPRDAASTPRRHGGASAHMSEGGSKGSHFIPQQHQQHPPQPPAAPASSAAIPADMTAYILELERQNAELRDRISTAQRESAAASLAHGGAASFLSGGSMPNDTGVFDPTHSQEEKRMFLNDVLSQVEVVVQAHRNRTESEIQRYKQEAEEAQLALRNLRNAIQQEGMDLSLAPAMIGFQRKTAKKGSILGDRDDAPSPVSVSLPAESQQLLESLSEDVLHKLINVKSSDDVPEVVRRVVKEGFESIVVYFTDQLMANFKESEAAMDEAKSEIKNLKDEIRTQMSINENQRVQLVQETEGEIQALRDQIHSFHVAAAGGDDIQAAVYQKAMDEYTTMLLDARKEVTHLRQELENEKNHSAQVCLRLKTALKKRNSEFESAVIQRAEDVVQQRERWIVELETKLRERESAAPKEFREIAVQAGDPSLHSYSEETFVTSLLTSMRRDQKTTAKQNEVFEKEVWRKTQELLTKYGGSK